MRETDVVLCRVRCNDSHCTLLEMTLYCVMIGHVASAVCHVCFTCYNMIPRRLLEFFFLIFYLDNFSIRIIFISATNNTPRSPTHKTDTVHQATFATYTHTQSHQHNRRQNAFCKRQHKWQHTELLTTTSNTHKHKHKHKHKYTLPSATRSWLETSIRAYVH